MSKTSTASTWPGWAPSIKTGPVMTESCSIGQLLPSFQSPKRSLVSITNPSPGRTRAAGECVASKVRTVWSLVIFCIKCLLCGRLNCNPFPRQGPVRGYHRGGTGDHRGRQPFPDHELPHGQATTAQRLQCGYHRHGDAEADGHEPGDAPDACRGARIIRGTEHAEPCAHPGMGVGGDGHKKAEDEGSRKDIDAHGDGRQRPIFAAGGAGKNG